MKLKGTKRYVLASGVAENLNATDDIIFYKDTKLSALKK